MNASRLPQYICSQVDSKEDKRFVYLKNFAAQYEIFCLDKSLSPLASKIDIQRGLISDHNARVSQLLCRRIYRVRWRTELDEPPTILADRTLPPTLPPRSEPEARAAAVKAIIQTFCDERVVVDAQPGEFIDVETRPGPSGATRLGFRPELEEWCKRRGVQAPTLTLPHGLHGNRWARALPKKAKFADEFKARKITGLAWADHEDTTGRVRLSWAWYFLEFAAVLLHVSFTFVLPIVVIWHALTLQELWALYICPAMGVGGRQPLMWDHVVGNAWDQVQPPPEPSRGPNPDPALTLAPTQATLNAMATSTRCSAVTRSCSRALSSSSPSSSFSAPSSGYPSTTLSSSCRSSKTGVLAQPSYPTGVKHPSSHLARLPSFPNV